MTRISEHEAQLAGKAVWSVVVVYEDPAARERAVSFCDQLVTRFWTGFEFAVNWWSFALLDQLAAAREATRNAGGADLIVIAATAEGDFPTPVKGWVEAWLRLRGDREGMLAGLVEPSANPSGWEGQKHNYLRNAAHRGAMDYLTQVPQDIARAFPDSLDSYTRRADQVTSILDGILHQQAPPPHLVP